MKRSTFSVLFIAKTHKLLKNGKAPIFVRSTINGKTIELSVKENINPDDWDAVGNCSKRKKTKSGRELNEYLDEVKSKFLKIKKEFESDDIELTVENVKNRYLGVDQNKFTLVKTYQEHNENLRKMVGNGIAAGTVERHDTSLRHIIQFLQMKYNKADVSFGEINQKFISDYEVFLKTERRCAHNTTVKYIKNLGKIIRIALNNDWMKKDPFANVSLKLQEVETDFLEKDELENLINTNFQIKRIERIKDVFVFCCFTGLAFIDANTLKQEHIVNGINGKKWIKKRRQKTKNMCNIPLLPIAEQILKKYEDDPVCQKKEKLLPIASNQKMNAYLKEIAALCNINKELTTHVARHTFATTVTLTNKVSMEAVSKMLGHSSLKMTRKYARIVDQLVSDEMDKIMEMF
jgi:site-specific recombinase XerD